MARSAADRTDAAAQALDAFLRRQRARPEPIAVPADGPPPSFAAENRERPAIPPDAAPESAPLRLPHTDWLGHTLSVHGPSQDIAAFRRQVAGAGTIPWQLDAALIEEDLFHLLVTPAGQGPGLAGARVLARQLRDAVEARHALATARVGRSRACPFDLHSLCPVPADILRLGPEDPRALQWLWRNWGTTEPLRHVSVIPGGSDGAGWGVFFWSADWTPWRAVAHLRLCWPGLRIAVRPHYAAG